MKASYKQVSRIVGIAIAASALTACESPYSFMSSGRVSSNLSLDGGAKTPVVSPSSTPTPTSTPMPTPTATATGLPNSGGGGGSNPGSNGGSSHGGGDTHGGMGGDSHGGVGSVGGDGCSGVACAGDDPGVTDAMNDPAGTCDRVRSSELQVVSNDQSGAISHVRGRNNINQGTITEMSDAHGHFVVNANSLVQLGGDVRGNVHVLSSKVTQVSDVHGLLVIVNRDRAQAGASDVISQISNFRGNLLVCGFNVSQLSDVRGNVNVVGGTITSQSDVHGQVNGSAVGASQ